MAKKYSYTRLSTAEACMKQYRFKYEDRVKPTNAGHSARFTGTAVHGVSEDLVRDHVKARKVGRLDANKIPDLLRKQWAKAGVPGDSEEFGEALAWLRRWAALEGELDWQVVAGIEKKFEVEIAGAVVFGVLDRVDFEFGELSIVDYKTNRALLSTEELASNLQLSIYALAARELWPDALETKLALYMMRHGVYQRTTRTPLQLEAAELYIGALIDGIEGATKYPARINANCAWCLWADKCEEIQALLAKEPESVAAGDVSAACRQRTKMHAIEKAAAAKKRDAEKVIREALKRQDEIQAEGHVFSLYQQSRTDLDAEQVLRTLARATDEDPLAIAGKICKITKGSLEEYVESLPLDPGIAMALAAELEVLGEERTTPRLSIRKGRRA